MALKEGVRVFLRFDSPSRGRVLQSATLSEIREDSWTLSFDERHHAVDLGEERLVYYNQARAFMQQRVRIEAQSSSGPPFLLHVRTLGDATSVGTREEDRVSTLGSGLVATLDDEVGCVVQDVSLSGLAAVSSRKYPVGRCLEIALHYGGEEFVGQVEIQCAHPIDSEQTRYGMLGVFDTAEGRRLQNALTRITLEIQQQRLKILSRSS